MTDFQERIDRDTPPAIQAEHDHRYRATAGLVARSGTWVDLGCGNGLAPARVLGNAYPPKIVLADLEPAAVAAAALELGAPSVTEVVADLTDPESLARIEAELLRGAAPRVATCFEVVEHLTSFLPLLQWAVRLAELGAATFAMSVPNDALWSIENPFHTARWGEGAFDELRRLLPADHTVLSQIALTGSVLVCAEQSADHQVSCRADAGIAPSHLLVAFGPDHADLAGGATVTAHDQREQRRWERQRESNLAFAEAALQVREREVATLAADVERLTSDRDEWRAYIHELERELGRPLAGSDAARAASGS